MKPKADDEDDEVEPPRNFTLSQLHENDGTKVLRKGKPSDEYKPIYISLCHTVYNVSSARDEYGPGGMYEAYAGHECALPVGKMSFDGEYIDSEEFESLLSESEKHELQRLIDRFERSPDKYPVLGRLVPKCLLPSPERIVTQDELLSRDGHNQSIPEGYAAAPIYVAIGGKVFDTSFGGVELYTPPDGAYSRFSGKDVSRALATMSFDDVGNTDISDLTEKQLKTMNDWVNNFETKRHYPVVGRLEQN
mmetsp:Transcript_30487/g.45396  ORF Transcript_30487/g.45396 Transcript_30487/m.45396 type:complete len:249 (-) Transcript_30487:188-934(-)